MKIEEHDGPNLCLNCRRRLRTCVCRKIRPFETRSRFIILMHPMEYKKEKVGTGRFSHLILKNSELIVGINFDENQTLQRILNDPEYQSYLLYPGENSIDLSSDCFTLQIKKRAQFIVIDGTWPCAKKMMKLSTCLHHLPRVSFNQTNISQFTVKHQPIPGCLSTVESIYHLIAELDRMKIENTTDKKENLIQVFQYTVAQQLELIENPPTESYRIKPKGELTQRGISKKWQKRKVFFL